MKDEHPNPGATFQNHAPVVASSTDATGIAPNMPLNEGDGMKEDLGGISAQEALLEHVNKQAQKYNVNDQY